MPPQVPGEGEAAELPLCQLRGPGHILQPLYPLQRVPHMAQPHLRRTHISSRPLYSGYRVRTPAAKGPWPSSCCCCQGNCAVGQGRWVGWVQCGAAYVDAWVVGGPVQIQCKVREAWRGLLGQRAPFSSPPLQCCHGDHKGSLTCTG